MLQDFDTLLLDMNGTFMFGHDRFGAGENYGLHFEALGGELPGDEAHSIIQAMFDYLAARYPNPAFLECFPDLHTALDAVLPSSAVSSEDRQRLISTFAYHELGSISEDYRNVLVKLGTRYQLGLVADIWSPRQAWLDEFQRAGVSGVFRAMSFSSDLGIVKPLPKPFLHLLGSLQSRRAVVIGDSVRRDLGGATAAGLPCILVGGATHTSALASIPSLLYLIDQRW